MNNEYALNDAVTMNGRIVGINTHTLVVELENSRMRVLIRPEDINTIHPYQPVPETDSRKGE